MNTSLTSKLPAIPAVRASPLLVRILLAATIGLLSAALCYYARLHIYPGPGDFLWPLRSARDLLAGRDPYAYPFHRLQVPYPLPAAFVGLPFVRLPDQIAAAAIFFGRSSSLLAFGLLRDGPAWRLWLFGSPLYLHSLMFAQWPPLLMAMAFFPSLLFLGLVKPHMAFPLAFSGYVRWTWPAVLFSAAVGVASLLVMPDWPLRFVSQLGPYEGVSPLLVLSGGGPIILLALLRWRHKEARLLLLMSLMPQRAFYDQLSLWFIPRSKREMLVLTLASWIGVYSWLIVGSNWPAWVVVSIYLPALVMVLQSKT